MLTPICSCKVTLSQHRHDTSLTPVCSCRVNANRDALVAAIKGKMAAINKSKVAA